MIISKIYSGLGNQMFQYAAARRLADKHKTILKLDISWYQSTDFRRFELDKFHTRFEIASAKEIEKYSKHFDRFRFRERFLNTNFYFQNQQGFDPQVLNLKDQTYLDGYFQSERYFEDIEKDIRNDFLSKSNFENKNSEIFNDVKSTNSVSVHIRRADYLHQNQLSIVLPEFYTLGISRISEEITDPVFFFFSDDINWVKQNIMIPYKHHFINHNSGQDSYLDMLLMSHCKHNIIANSTFSWWGAWLNQNPKKRVLSPKEWFANKPTTDILPKNWLKI